MLFGNVETETYKAMILLVVLCGCETWSLALRKEHRLRVFESRVLMRIFGPKRDEIIGGWGKLHNVVLHNLYSLPNFFWSRDSSVSIALGYELDGPGLIHCSAGFFSSLKHPD
jgi:hypothetical protein